MKGWGLCLLLVSALAFACFNYGRYYQRMITLDEVRASDATTIKIPSLGVTIFAPKGTIMWVKEK